MADDLKLIFYPDPRLKRMSQPVKQLDQGVRSLAGQMLRLMRDAKGVGLAAPQVGSNIRLFVINPSGEPGDDYVYINPLLSDPEGQEEAEEGCLSLPEIHVKVTRNKRIRIQAQDLDAPGHVPCMIARSVEPSRRRGGNLRAGPPCDPLHGEWSTA